MDSEDEKKQKAAAVKYVAYGADDTNALIAAPKKKKKNAAVKGKDGTATKKPQQKKQQQNQAAATTTTTGEAKGSEPAKKKEGKMSRAKRKRVEQFKAKMAKQEARKEMMAALEKTMLRPEEAPLYHSSSEVGRSNRETAKQHLKRLLLEKKAGISVTPDGGRPLVEEVEVDESKVEWEHKGDEGDGESEGEGEVKDEGNEEDSETEAKTTVSSANSVAIATKTGGSDNDGGEGEGDGTATTETTNKAKEERKKFFAKAAEAKHSGPDIDLDTDEVRDKKWKEAREKRLQEWVDTKKKELEEEAKAEAEKEEEDKDERCDEPKAEPTVVPGMAFGFGSLRAVPGVIFQTDANDELNDEEDESEEEEEEDEGDYEEDDESKEESGEEGDDAEGNDEEGDGEDEGEEEEATTLEPEVEEAPTPKRRRRSSIAAASVVFTERPVGYKPPVFVQVSRPADVEESRGNLPITMEEQSIMEAIHDNDVVIICGETGSGKTTQVPQFLFEAGYGSPESKETPGLIGITQPRRVAAISMSQRVGYELGFGGGKEVAYQVRYDRSTVSKERTRMKFMTDGILLREIQGDFTLSAYSVVIIDEAHERNINTDILIGLLSRIVPLRNKLAREGKPATEGGKPALPLKLVIMSATLRVEDFTNNKSLFPVPPPVIKIAARQFPVTVHFNRKTAVGDYVGEAFSKVVKIHTMLPPGGILVFLTGQREIEHLCRRLRRRFPAPETQGTAGDNKQRKGKKDADLDETEETKTEADGGDGGDDDDGAMVARDEEAEDPSGAGNDDGDDYEDDGMSDGEDDIVDGGEEDDDGVQIATATPRGQGRAVHVLPLYSVLSPKRQREVFEPPPPGSRLIVVATNVAETALTIPGITYVVDCGRVKQRKYDNDTGISRFAIEWTSKASAEQRAGRAGRTGPGHCYRIYSSAVYNDYFPKFAEPEILVTPIEGTVLQMKSMGIDKITAFPFPTPPDRLGVASAARLLLNIGALDEAERITRLGRTIARFPVNPRFAKMLVLAHRSGCLPWVVTIVAALSVRDLFSPMQGGSAADPEETSAGAATSTAIKVPEIAKRCREMWASADSDFLATLKAIEACRHAVHAGETVSSFCNRHGLHQQSLEEILKLREQLAAIMSEPLSGLCAPPNVQQQAQIRQVIAGGLVDQVARRLAPEELNEEQRRSAKGPAFVYAALSSDEHVFIHPSSFLAQCAPEYVVYHEIVRSKRPYMRGITRVQPGWLVQLGPALATLSKPLTLPPPRYDAPSGDVKCFVRVSYGPQGWQLPIQAVSYPHGGDRCRLFAQYLLQGAVFKPLERFQGDLTVQPMSVTQSNSSKVIALVDALLKSGVDSRDALAAKWKAEPSFLLHQYLQFVAKPKHPEVASVWPPIPK